ncbi:nucleoid-associated protein [Reichenbachiella versicolor]|uniref:nucleoid-associated protein n=1 Tax=Reichenbachiella versicolor TaxID=1821036 RepID=UPI000D6E5EF8|nr:nucleoid-associated protein [Reichenbachiella versicolor]
MSLTDLEIVSINRLIAHEVHPKTKELEAFAVTSNELLTIGDDDKGILKNRLHEALSKTNKTFKLEFQDESERSVFSFLKSFDDLNDEKFLENSQELAHKLAGAHYRAKIPGGYCLIGDGRTSQNQNFFFIIKAELQEVFSISGHELQVIEDVFLSPAKDFYKIGFFIKEGSTFRPYMYDDLFNLQKKDLTEYFYGKFLGLTTDRNDKLKSKNFYNDSKFFIESNVNNLSDRVGLLKALDVMYREQTSGIISPRDFSNNYLEGRLKTRFEYEIIREKYSEPFTKDVSLLSHKLKLKRISIPLACDLSIIGYPDELESIKVIDGESNSSVNDLQLEINNGLEDKIVVVLQKMEN